MKKANKSMENELLKITDTIGVDISQYVSFIAMISTVVSALTVGIKKFMRTTTLLSSQWYPVYLNIGTVIVAFGVSFGALLFSSYPLSIIGVAGCFSALTAIGGYEMIVNLFRCGKK